MRKQTHILNGDSLKKRFPKEIQGDILVARECLVEGSVEGEKLSVFYQNRATFLSQIYKETSKEEYYRYTVPEFEKMIQLTDDTDINLWFEDDLFCQVNFWFVLYLLTKSNTPNNLFLIRPKTHSQYGFGGLSKSELLLTYKNRTPLIELEKLSLLWTYYKSDQIEKLAETANVLRDKYPFIFPAVEAHIQRIPVEGNPGRPIQSLIQIMQDLKTAEFGPVFREFCKREYLYGYGDLQVKRLLDTIQTNGQ